MQKANAEKASYYTARHWAQQHKMHLPQVALPKALQNLILEWFTLVDSSGSGSISADELLQAFSVCSSIQPLELLC